MKYLEEVALKGKRVILRTDLNVPLSKESPPKILDDYRLKAVLPTLHYLLERRAKVIIMAHLGKPKNGAEAGLSLRIVYERLADLLNTPIKFAPQHFSEATKKAVAELEDGEVLGLENLRFDPGEAANSRTFARKLSEYGDIYVDDAFGSAHREAASMVAITEFLPSYAGLLMEKEVSMLTTLMRHPARPFIAVIGGAKISDKLPLIRRFLHLADRILVGGGVANTFLLASGMDVKQSLVDGEFLDEAKAIYKEAAGKIILPADYVWDGEKILDIGPDTVKLFEGYINTSKTVFWNGCLGYTEDAKFSKGSDEIAKFIAEHGSTSVVGGGNTVEVLTKLGLTNKITFVSSGGGATLELLGGEKLPGLVALN